MAIADILGSNMFNLALIALVDLAYSRGALLSSVSSSHLITAAVVVVMNLIVILGLRFRQKRKTFRIISWHALALIGFYIFAAYALFRSGIGLG
jgi:cation:H+ antiporter